MATRDQVGPWSRRHVRLRAASLAALARAPPSRAHLSHRRAHFSTRRENLALGVRVLEHRARGRSRYANGLIQRVAHQLEHVLAAESVLAQPGHRRLLFCPALELGLDELVIADVRDHPVPADASLRVRDQSSFIANPYRPAVAVADAVVVRRARVFEPLLALEDAVAVLGVHLPRPQPGIVDPFLGREAEHRLDPLADVLPASAHAHLGHVQDRGHLLQKRLNLHLRQPLAGVREPRARA